MGAGVGVEAARGEDLRDLFGELVVDLQGFFDFGADACGEALAERGRSCWSRVVGCLDITLLRQECLSYWRSYWEGLRECAVDGRADAALEVVVGGVLEGGVGGKTWIVVRGA